MPFDADNFMGILTQHMYKAPVPILAIVPPPVGVPPGLDAIIQKCLSKKPEQRYPTMAALTADLEKVENGLVPDAVPEMMARSGGFNVPADYFRSNAGMPAPVPGTPLGAPRTRWGLYAGVAGIATCVGLVVLHFREERDDARDATAGGDRDGLSRGSSSGQSTTDCEHGYGWGREQRFYGARDRLKSSSRSSRRTRR